MRTAKTLLFLALGLLYIATGLGCSAASPVTGPEGAPGADEVTRNSATTTTVGGWQPTNDGAVETQFGKTIRLHVLPPNREADAECGSENDMDHSHAVFKGNKPIVTVEYGQTSTGPWDLTESNTTNDCGGYGIGCIVPVKDENGLYVLEERNGHKVMKTATYHYVQVQVIYCSKMGDCYQLVPALLIECPEQVTNYPISLQAAKIDYPYDIDQMMMPPPNGLLPEDPPQMLAPRRFTP